MKIVAISGYFDPIHKGHIEYMKLAKELADKEGAKLVVIMNSDEQALLKKEKVFMPYEERKKIVQSIGYIDEIFDSIDKDKSVCKSLEALKPEIFAKGGDRFEGEIPETEICHKLGIKIIHGLGDKIESSSTLTGIKPREENESKEENRKS